VRRFGCIAGDRGAIIAAVSTLLSEACIETGSLDEALAALSEALETGEEHEIRHYQAETCNET
jgi:hypothetical protein